MTPQPSLFGAGDMQGWRVLAERAMAAILRSRLSIAIFALLFAGLGVTAATQMPKTFSAEARLLARRTDVMPALAHPRRSVPASAESLTQSAGDLVRDRQALRAIVDEYDLLTRWEASRSPLYEFKDSVFAWIAGAPTREQRLESLIDVLAKRVMVTVDGDVIRVSAKWGDPSTAVDIVNGATEAFLRARKRVDIDAIAETYTLLERTADVARADVERRVATAAAMPRVATQAAPAASVPSTQAAADTAALTKMQTLVTLRADVLAARRAVDALSAAQQKDVLALEAELTERLSRATDRHPDVVALRRRLEQARVPSPEQTEAEAAARRQLNAFLAAGGSEADLVEGSLPRFAAAAPAPAAPGVSLTRIVGDDAATVYARSLLESSIASYQDLLERLSNTRIELETARAAFDYRYTIIKPAQLPRRSDSPSGVLMIAGAVMAGVALGMLRAVAGELRSLVLTEVRA